MLNFAPSPCAKFCKFLTCSLWSWDASLKVLYNFIHFSSRTSIFSKNSTRKNRYWVYDLNLLFLLETTFFRDSVKRVFSLYQNENRVTTISTLGVIPDKKLFFQNSIYWKTKEFLKKIMCSQYSKRVCQCMQ